MKWIKEFHGSNKYQMRNGSKLVEERMSLFHGKTNPIRCFSAAELNAVIISRSRSNSSSKQISFCAGDFTWYNGVVDGRKVLIGRSHWDNIREIAVSTEMSSHNNVHKLLGCCLDTKHPVLVFEWLDVDGCMYDRLFAKNSQRGLEWKDRLRIAWEISHAVSYLHNAFPRPIIHRDINPYNVLLDQQKQDNSIAKLSGFHLSVSIPEGKTHVETLIAGTLGYLAPECAYTSRVDEKVDVYAYGVLLLVLLTGQEAIHTGENGEQKSLIIWVREREALIHNEQARAITEIIDPAITSNVTSTTQEDLLLQLQVALKLGLRCIAPKGENRPTMVEVATQLKSMVDRSL